MRLDVSIHNYNFDLSKSLIMTVSAGWSVSRDGGRSGQRERPIGREQLSPQLCRLIIWRLTSVANTLHTGATTATRTIRPRGLVMLVRLWNLMAVDEPGVWRGRKGRRSLWNHRTPTEGRASVIPKASRAHSPKSDARPSVPQNRKRPTGACDFRAHEGGQRAFARL